MKKNGTFSSSFRYEIYVQNPSALSRELVALALVLYHLNRKCWAPTYLES